MPAWIDTHVHLDAPEFDADRDAVRTAVRDAGVALCVLQSIDARSWPVVRALAHRHGDAYALGIHPLFTPAATAADIDALERELASRRDDPRLVAVGEIGLDYFVPGLDGARQEEIYRAQLRLARRFDLPVVLHVRKSSDRLLRALREVGGGQPWQGIAHAFNGSRQQAEAFIDLGLKLGFGGAATFERALQLRRLAAELPLDAIVAETDSPDIPPQWLYRTAAERAAGAAQGRNTPAELPRIGAALAGLRGLTADAFAEATARNAVAALPRLEALL
ncbi:TatD family hydrolase [Xylophilus sp.]|uniref:TatD family hydrolase n=1 Tax=Xylophilus sp. TaxID=2653893 RepID=UPI002D7E37B3|nr:TatD family hydrolase [Xylophilus sp.]